MITKQQANMINYLVICVSDFAERFAMDSKAAYRFLAKFGGIDFLVQHYDIEHTLSLDEAVDDLEMVCCQNGGIETVIRGLEYKSLTTQYSFHTEKALQYLSPTEG